MSTATEKNEVKSASHFVDDNMPLRSPLNDDSIEILKMAQKKRGCDAAENEDKMPTKTRKTNHMKAVPMEINANTKSETILESANDMERLQMHQKMKQPIGKKVKGIKASKLVNKPDETRAQHTSNSSKQIPKIMSR